MREPIGYRPTRRHPYQVLIAGMCVLGGLPVLFGEARPGSLNAALPPAMVTVWGGILVTCGLLVVAAAVVRSTETALYLEMVADPPLALAALAFGLAAFFIVGLPALAGGSIIIGFGVAAAWRFGQVMASFRRFRRMLEEEDSAAAAVE